MKVCHSCNGTGQYLGLGCVKEICKGCNGRGRVEESAPHPNLLEERVFTGNLYQQSISPVSSNSSAASPDHKYMLERAWEDLEMREREIEQLKEDAKRFHGMDNKISTILFTIEQILELLKGPSSPEKKEKAVKGNPKKKD